MFGRGELYSQHDRAVMSLTRENYKLYNLKKRTKNVPDSMAYWGAGFFLCRGGGWEWGLLKNTENGWILIRTVEQENDLTGWCEGTGMVRKCLWNGSGSRFLDIWMIFIRSTRSRIGGAGLILLILSGNRDRLSLPLRSRGTGHMCSRSIGPGTGRN